VNHLGEHISDLVDGRLSAAQAETAHAHLASCRPCRDMVEAERLTKARLVSLEAPVPTADLIAGLLALPQSPRAADTPPPFAATSPGLPPDVVEVGLTGSRRPAGAPRSSRPGGLTAAAASAVRPPAGRSARSGRRGPRRPERLRFAAALAGSVGVIGASVFGLSVVSPAANNAITPTANLSVARNVVTMSGLPMVTLLPAWWVAHGGSGR
jgi:hypothetical protein